MAIRFRKYIKLAPGVRMNLSGSGLSWTLGPRGMSVGVGKRGNYLNTGIPGSGLFARARLSHDAASVSGAPRSNSRSVEISVSINDEGVLSFADSMGNPIPEVQINAAKKQQGDKIKALIQGKCDELNEQVESLGRLHEYTSIPRIHKFEAPKFDIRPPQRPVTKVPGFFSKFFKSSVAKIEAQNQMASEKYEADVVEWNREKAEFEKQVEADREFFDRVNAGDVVALEQYFEAVLQDIVWTRETLVSFDIRPDRTIAIDVDLPEIEEMPTKTASVPQRGYRLSVKDMSPTQIQKLYMRHVHAIGIRIAGEAFATSQAIEFVTLSAYSQRPSKATGQVMNEYLYSVRIGRPDWLKINFDNLAQLDVIEVLEQFDLRRNMTKTGIFKSIEPFE